MTSVPIYFPTYVFMFHHKFHVIPHRNYILLFAYCLYYLTLCLMTQLSRILINNIVTIFPLQIHSYFLLNV